MAKKKPSMNKSEAIRKFKADNPEIGPKEIAATLGKQGYGKITAQFVSTVLSNDRRKQGKSGKRGRPAGEFTSSELMKVKQLVDEVGGFEAAVKALEAYGKLLG